jgi:hypothetical protein
MGERQGFSYNRAGPAKIALDGPSSMQIASKNSLKYVG